jgi:regulator of replication initiation timing
MYCIKCGKEIAEGELFCVECSLIPDPVVPAAAEKKAVKKPADPAPKVQPAKADKAPKTSQPAKPAAKPAPKPAPKQPVPAKQARPWGLIICLLVALAVAAGAVAYIALNYQDLNQQKAALRVREADLSLRENEIADLQTAYDKSLDDLADMTDQRDTLQDQVTALQDEINGNESERNQTQYDISTKEKEIERLTEENDTLGAEVTALEQDNALKDESIEQLTTDKETLETDLADMTDQRDTLQSDYDALKLLSDGYQVKSDFLDDYIVFVLNNGSSYYHNFDCPNFTRRDFWAYNRSLAVSNGYSACPVCGG